MAANQLLAPPMLGWPITAMAGNASSLGLNAAATWLAYQFVPDQAKALSTARAYLLLKTGTPATTDCTCDLYSDSSGVPGTSLESHAADSVPASGNWMQWSGFATALTAGAAYWLVFKNANATPASNFPTYQWVASAAGAVAGVMPLGVGQYQLSGGLFGWNKVHTTNSGAAWATGIMNGVGGFRLGFSDSTYAGFPSSGSTRPSSSSGTADGSFGKQEAGVRFNLPAGITFNVRGAWMPVVKNGTPGNLSFKLWQGSTLLAQTAAVPAANVTSALPGDAYCAYFSSAQAISSAGNPYRLTFADTTAADTSSNRYNSFLVSWDGDANSQTLKPMAGSLQETVTADNTASPPVFTDTPTNLFPFALLLDTGGPFTGGGGAVSPIIVSG